MEGVARVHARTSGAIGDDSPDLVAGCLGGENSLLLAGVSRKELLHLAALLG
jgi:hypothetical protein